MEFNWGPPREPSEAGRVGRGGRNGAGGVLGVKRSVTAGTEQSGISSDEEGYDGI